MWLPKTEEEIVSVITNGNIEESSILDAKIELPANNYEIAKDIAAMSNDGGVLIFGIGEDENKRLKILHPIPLKGQPERIDAIVHSSISEPPTIKITTIPTKADESIGYILVNIPPSERAPHMVVVKGENRFYGRSSTGNKVLSEGEVARLYSRRQNIEVNLDVLIDKEINSCPISQNPRFSFLYLFSRPIYSREGFFDSIITTETDLRMTVISAINQVIKKTIFIKDGLHRILRIQDLGDNW